MSIRTSTDVSTIPSPIEQTNHNIDDWFGRLVALQDPSAADNPETAQLLQVVTELLLMVAEQPHSTPDGMENSELSALMDGLEQISGDDLFDAENTLEDATAKCSISNDGKKEEEKPGCEQVKHKHKHGFEKRLKKILHKTGKRIRHHKKEILIGAAVAVALGAVIATGGSAAAALGGGIGAAATGGTRYDRAMRRKKETEPSENLPPCTSAPQSNEKTVEETRYDRAMRIHSNQPAELVPPSFSTQAQPNRNFFAHAFDEEHILREHCFKTAEIKAKEIRYPGLVHSAKEIEATTIKTEKAFEKFRADLIGSVDADDASKILGLVVDVSALSKMSGKFIKPAMMLKVAQDTSKVALEQRDKVAKLYEPVKIAHTELRNKDSANKAASLARCEKEGYRPKLEFHPKGSADPNVSVLVDKNNPNPNEITVELP